MAERSHVLSLHLERVLPAPPPAVFAAATEPRLLAEWWGPAGFTTPSIALDLRPGGAYRIAMKPPGRDVFHLSGRFRAIDPPRLLAYTFAWEPADPDDRENLVTLSLGDEDGATRLTVDHGPFATRERLDLHVRGWTESLERLRGVLSRRSAPRRRPGAPDDPDPEAAMPDRTPRETALAYMEAWNAMDADGCAACFAEDGVREGRILARATAGGARFPRFVGREAIRERIHGFMVAVPDLRIDVLRVGEGPEDTAWLEWHLTGTHRGDWGAWAARGERVDVPAVSIYRVRGGLIAEETEYIDPAVMMTPPG